MINTKLTLRTAYEYLRPDHKPRTCESYESLLSHWEAAPLTVVMPEAGTLHLRVPESDPCLTRCDNVTLVDFKNYLTGKLASSNSVRKYLKHLFVIFRRIGPKDLRNPEGLGLIRDVPYVKPPKEVIRPVVTIEDHEVEALYEAAEEATWPKCELPAALWWQSLIVVLYNVGFRRLDFLSARMDEFDLRRAVVTFDAEKTGKSSALPLHPVVLAHLEKVWNPPRVLVWPWRYHQLAPDPIDRKKTSLYSQWHRIRKAAGIMRKITPHDLRRTCGSDLFASSPAAASECLQHSSIVTTQRSYSNCSRQTRELMLDRPQPAAFTMAPSETTLDPMILKFPRSG